ncbi:MAG: hypothetical protein WCV92_01285 [Candidatus Buchananbacteria bacterium]|jgi:hypothetical protein
MKTQDNSLSQVVKKLRRAGKIAGLDKNRKKQIKTFLIEQVSGYSGIGVEGRQEVINFS